MKMHVGGQWVDKSEKIEVLNPFSGSVIDTIPREGLSGNVAFIHPRSVFGVLTELVEN